MRSYQRKSTPDVIAGRVQKKNAWGRSLSDYYDVPQRHPIIDRKRPGSGYRHVLTKRDIDQFIPLLPDWDALSKGLNAIVLAPGEWNICGYHVPGVVHVCAWEADLWTLVTARLYEEHRDIWERLGVPCERQGADYLCQWCEPTIRAYQLLHILLHELGHHHDRMTTRSQVRTGRGEPYSESYARRQETLIWDRYWQVFNLD